MSNHREGVGSALTTPSKPASAREILCFIFDGIEVRAVDRDGNPWFVGKDVCRALGQRNTKDALSRIADRDRASVMVPDALRRDQSTTIISLGAVFKLAMTSRVLGAERFQEWITHEVLPQIHRTGGYGTTARIAELEAQLARQPDLSALPGQIAQLAAQIGRLTDQLAARPAAPAPALPSPFQDGMLPLGTGSVVMKTGKPVEIRARLGAVDDLAAVEAAFKARFGRAYHVAPAPPPSIKPDWRWAPIGFRAAVVPGPMPTAAERATRFGRVVRNAAGVECAVETVPGADVVAIRAEALRLGIELGAWNIRGGVVRARIVAPSR